LWYLLTIPKWRSIILSHIILTLSLPMMALVMSAQVVRYWFTYSPKFWDAVTWCEHDWSRHRMI
jgi:hypothetical protein